MKTSTVKTLTTILDAVGLDGDRIAFKAAIAALFVSLILLQSCTKSDVGCDVAGPTQDLSVYFPLNGNVSNQSCNGDDLSKSIFSSGVVLTTDRGNATNGAYQFNGINSLIYLNNVTYGSDVTMSCWVKLDNLNQNGVIMYYGSAGFDGFGFIVNDGYCGRGNRLAMLAGGVNCDLFNSKEIISDLNWRHITLVKQDKSFSLFVNGALKQTGSIQINPPTKRLFVGGHDYPSTNNVFLNGKIDDVRLYNRALTQDEVLNLYLLK